MKKLLLHLTLLFAGVLSAQEGLPTPSYAAHFTGHIAGGRMGTAAAPQSTNATLVADRHNNLNDAISNVSGSSYITLPGAANSMTSNFSISFWYKKTGTFQGNLNHRPFFTAPNTSTIGYGEGTFLGLNNDGTKFVFGNVINTPITGSQSKEVNIPANVNVEEWNYYTLIRENATTLALYVNNVFLDNKENITFSSINGNGNIYLGGYSLGSSFASCQGHFDNLKIYHNPLSETQRTALYNWEMGDSYRGEIKAKYDFNDITNIGADTYGNFPAVANNAPDLAPDRHGNPNSAMQVYGFTQQRGIRIPYLNDYFTREKGTIAYWIKPSQQTEPGTHPILFLPNQGRNGTNLYLNSVFNNYTANGTNLYVSGVNSATTSLVISGATFNYNKWQHIAMTFENSTMKVYYNGVLQGQYTISNFPDRINGAGQDISFGYAKYNTVSASYNGLLDELLFDSTVYTEQQIADMYDMEDEDYLADNASYIANFSGNIAGGMKGNQYNFPTLNSSIALTTDRNGNAKSAVEITTTGGLVKLPQTADKLLTNFTVSFWYKKSSSIQPTGTIGSHRIFFNARNDSYNAFGEGIFVGITPNEASFQWGYVLTTGNGGTSFVKTSSFPANFTLTDWNYYTLERVGNTLKLYVNNQFIDQRDAITFSGFLNSTNEITLGGFSNNDNINNSYCPGAFDNLRIYRGVLSPEVRTEIYNWELNDSQRNTTVKAKYDFNENAVTTDTFDNYPAVTVNDPQLGTDRNGNLNSALAVSSSNTKQGIKIPYLNDYFTQQQGTISFWFKANSNGRSFHNYNPVIYLPNQDFSYGFAMTAGLNTENALTFQAGSMRQDHGYGFATNNGIALNTWYHCAVTFDNTTLKLYINGTLVNTSAIDAFPSRNNGGSQNITIGYADYGYFNTQFDGLIDEVMLENVAFTSQQISNLYQNLSINDNQISKISIYPNPAIDVLNISQMANEITIYDVFGRIILAAKNTSEVNITNLSSGNYIVKLNIDGNSFTQKFIKK